MVGQENRCDGACKTNPLCYSVLVLEYRMAPEEQSYIRIQATTTLKFNSVDFSNPHSLLCC